MRRGQLVLVGVYIDGYQAPSSVFFDRCCSLLIESVVIRCRTYPKGRKQR